MELSALLLDRAVAQDLVQQAEQLPRSKATRNNTHVTLNLLTAWP